MENNSLGQPSPITILVKKYNLQNIFVPFFLIFASLCVFVVGYIINRRTLANVYEMYSYVFVAASFGLFLKVFVTSYANSLYTIINKKWVLLGFNLIFFTIQIFFGALAAYVLTDSTFILYPLQNLLIASAVFYLQNLIDDNFKILNLSLWGVVVYLILYLLTLFRIFDSDNRFWNTAGLIALVIEVILFFVSTRKFMKAIQ